eukprot:scaffold1798_cov248-Pinguiococcus_pyrenoidosus.AAC.9
MWLYHSARHHAASPAPRRTVHSHDSILRGALREQSLGVAAPGPAEGQEWARALTSQKGAPKMDLAPGDAPLMLVGPVE